ncbi:MAG: HlyD family efflux transporter periplasmic adaptor subunit, partial [Lachnospiraceae bacterium]|nr:HlyD family efflux transporter periplasmic adaptor subunit [Lachnospiraceae bacterium]
MEKRTKREWIKTAAIIFLSAMLVLTFFSNTIMNHSLPEVNAQYVQSDTITAKIRGGGVVESGDPYNVTMEQTRKIASVPVKVGDKVNAGDVLLYLEDKDSTELKAAQEKYDAAVKAYDQLLLSAEVTAAAVSGAASGRDPAAYRNQLSDAISNNVNATKTYTQLNNRKTEIEARIKYLNSRIGSDDLTELETAKKNAKTALNTAETVKNTAVKQYETAKKKFDVSGGDSGYKQSDINELENDKIEAEEKYKSAVSDYEKAKKEYEDALDDDDDDDNSVSDRKNEIKNLQKELDEITLKLASATVNQTNAKDNLDTLSVDVGNIISLEYAYKDVSDALEELNKEKDKAIGATVDAKIAGTITEINTAAGKEAGAGETLLVIQPADKGYSMSFTVTNEQAKRLSVGDRAEIVNSWRYEEMDITLTSIKPDKKEPGQKKLLTFEIQGEVTPGQTINVSVGGKSATYDTVVPNSAIREDNNGKFVLVVETKSTPLSNRYIARRYDIDVLAADDTKSAISGALYGNEFVITTSTKPIEAGMQVRLANDT